MVYDLLYFSLQEERGSDELETPWLYYNDICQRGKFLKRLLRIFASGAIKKKIKLPFSAKRWILLWDTMKSEMSAAWWHVASRSTHTPLLEKSPRFRPLSCTAQGCCQGPSASTARSIPGSLLDATQARRACWNVSHWGWMDNRMQIPSRTCQSAPPHLIRSFYLHAEDFQSETLPPVPAFY